MNRVKFFQCLLVVLLANFMFIENLHAKLNNDFQSWNSLTIIGPFHQSKFKYWLEAQGRFGENLSRLSQSLMRPESVIKSPKTAVCGLGMLGYIRALLLLMGGLMKNAGGNNSYG